jgi:ATP-dependent Clp protease ATP-binding subunit ClpA
MFERFTREARATVVVAQAEARALDHGWLGTEHLLLGVLGDPGGRAARVLSARGVTAAWARAEVERVIGGGEPDIDADALAAIGIDLAEVRDRVERTFGPGALRRPRCRRGRVSPELPLTPRAKKTLELALREALAMGDRHIGVEHVLLGILREGEGVAARILAARGVDHGGVRALLADRTAR